MKVLRWNSSESKVNLERQAKVDAAKENDVVIEVVYSGVCGSDLMIMDKKMDAKDGVILGHEITGIVHEIGSNVQKVQIGDPVVVLPQSYCGVCRFCERGQVCYCNNYTYVGFDVHGGWAEFCTLPASQVYKLPTNLDLKQGLLVQPYSCVAVGWDNNGMVPDDARILVMGVGIIGLLWSCLFHHHGYRDVSITELSSDRRQIFDNLKLGYSSYSPDEMKEKFLKLDADQEGFDLIVDCTGSPKALSDSFLWLRKGGTLNMFGCCPEDAEMNIKPYTVMLKQLTIVGTLFNPFRFPSTLSLVAGMTDKYLSYEKLGIQMYVMEDYETAFNHLKSGKISKAVFDMRHK